jgi:hypothetical protein
VGLIIVLLVIAVRNNTWDLLVTVADWPRNGSTHQPR